MMTIGQSSFSHAKPMSYLKALLCLTSQPLIANLIIIGLDADMSSGSAKSGEAIRRGIELAIDEIDKNGECWVAIFSLLSEITGAILQEVLTILRNSQV
jgi:hypothetical protein